MKKTILIIIDGPIGAGKTTTSEILLKKLDKVAIIKLDRIKRFYSDYNNNTEFGLKLATKIGASIARTYLKNKISVIVEKAFTQEKYLKDFIKETKAKKSDTHIFQIECDLETRIKRVKKREQERINKGDKIKRLTKRKILGNSENYRLYKYKNAKVFDSSKLSPQQIANEIVKEVK